MSKAWIALAAGLALGGALTVGLRFVPLPIEISWRATSTDGRGAAAPSSSETAAAPRILPSLTALPLAPPRTDDHMVRAAFPTSAVALVLSQTKTPRATLTIDSYKEGADGKEPILAPADTRITSYGPVALTLRLTYQDFDEKDNAALTAQFKDPSRTDVIKLGNLPLTKENKYATTLPSSFQQAGAYVIKASFTDKEGKSKGIPDALLDVTLAPRTDLPRPSATKVSEKYPASGDLTYETTDFRETVRLVARQATIVVNHNLKDDDLKDTLNPVKLKIVGRNPRGEEKVFSAASAIKSGDPASALFPLDLPQEGGLYQLVAITSKGWTSVESDQTVPIWLAIPTPGIPASPILDQYGSGKYAADVSLPSTKIQIYNSYLRLRGRNYPVGGQLSFRVFEVKDTTLRRLKDLGIDSKPDDQGNWVAEFQLPADIADGLMIAYAEVKGQHNFSGQAVRFAPSPLGAISTVPVLKSVQFSPDRTAVDIGATFDFTKPVRGNVAATTLTGSGQEEGSQVLVLLDQAPTPATIVTDSNKDGTWTTVLKDLKDGVHQVVFQLARNGQKGNPSPTLLLDINTHGPTVKGVDPPTFGTAPGVNTLTIQFDPGDPLEENTARQTQNYELWPSNGSGVFGRGTDSPIPPDTVADFDKPHNRVVLKFNSLHPDIYQLVVHGFPGKTKDGKDVGIKDVYGNYLADADGHQGVDFKFVLGKAAGGDGDALPSESRGVISGEKAPFVEYKEYLDPRPPANGFNPSDHVETRVSRLYYYRDAHRVAQIINRDARSYNRQAVEVRRRLADQARDRANQLTDDRRLQESKAVRAAQDSREAEKQLKRDQDAQATARQQAGESQGRINQIDAQNAAETNPAMKERLKADRDTAKGVFDASVAVVQSADARIQADMQAVQAARAREVQESEVLQTKAAEEDRAHAEQFRREVAAAHEDPDTFAPGKPNSEDPVRQVSVSVIGEGIIQLRGPIKGINEIRTMINEIDAPVGQVRVAVHTVQVNGEHGDRMEKVVGRIQRYIDHARFLTAQSGQMLRKAVVLVASRKAEEIGLACPNEAQEARDQKYLYAFFGKDFVDELRALDSEFLRTGNKLLTLHSMDSTSLASALFLMALAKNSTRLEILEEFRRTTGADLIQAEENYFAAGSPDKDCHKFKLFAENARFQSLAGFFDSELSGADTINPIQREFIRLAQIFKSRLVVEMELRQRVTERAIIEQRLGDYIKELTDQQKREHEARDALYAARRKLNDQRAEAVRAFASFQAQIQDILRWQEECTAVVREAGKNQQRWKKLSEEVPGKLAQALATNGGTMQRFIAPPATLTPLQRQAYLYQEVKRQAQEQKSREAEALAEELRNQHIDLAGREIGVRLQDDAQTWLFRSEGDEQEWNASVDRGLEITRGLEVFVLPAPERDILKQVVDSLIGLRAGGRRYTPGNNHKLRIAYQSLLGLLQFVRKASEDVADQANRLMEELNRPELEPVQLFREWQQVRRYILAKVQGPLLDQARAAFTPVDNGFTAVLQLQVQVQVAQQTAAESRQPLDHKKLLDMLIDEMQDKYIELLEGTRAHTANIDNYIKTIATALDDDFNTQFYNPSFREVREASRYWDVSLGQIETTSVLTNNRAFAKVEPQATMEFDLPKRDILIAEAMGDAKALIDTYGALTQDPTFLALTKLRSGQPPSSPVQGASGGLSLVRNVLPGLPSSTEERVLSQGGPGNKQLAAPLEALIPDPAIYKFETGTGYEIRPVISPDGQAVVFHFNYMYTTNVREPVRADEKHLGRVKRHFVDTDVQLSNYELREVSRYVVALKASRTSRGVPGLEDIPGVGILFRPLPSAESALQENVIMAQATIFPTLFDLMGLRWAPAVADLDPLGVANDEFIVRGRRRDLMNHVFDYSTSKVDEFLRIPPADRRTDLYRSQTTIPHVHPNGYMGPGLNLRDSHLQEGYDPRIQYPESRPVPGTSKEGMIYPPREFREGLMGTPGYAPPGAAPLLPPPVPPPFAPPMPVPPGLPPSASGPTPGYSPPQPSQAAPGLPSATTLPMPRRMDPEGTPGPVGGSGSAPPSSGGPQVPPAGGVMGRYLRQDQGPALPVAPARPTAPPPTSPRSNPGAAPASDSTQRSAVDLSRPVVWRAANPGAGNDH